MAHAGARKVRRQPEMVPMTEEQQREMMGCHGRAAGQPCEVGLIRELYWQRSRGGAHLWGQEAHCFSQLAGWF